MQLSNNDLLEAVLNACNEVFSDLWGETITSQVVPPATGSADFGARILVGGSQSAEIALWVDRTSGKQLATRYLRENDPNDELVADVVRELANMLAGNVKTQMSQGEEDFDLALPRMDASPLTSGERITGLQINMPRSTVRLAIVCG